MSDVPAVPRAPETREVEFPFTLERGEDSGDGLTFEGYASVFNSPTQIRDHNGSYTEMVAPGAFAKSIRERAPVLMFDHGKHPMIGNIPIGKITGLREDARGLHVKARLIDNPTINIVRDAIAAEAITGMSFRFEVVRDNWTQGTKGARTRTLKEVKVPEIGPVVFPAYADTTAAVRSTVRALEERYPEIMHVELVARDDDVEISTQDQSVSDLVSDAVETLWGLTDETSDAYIIDLYDDHAIFTVQGVAQAKYPGLWNVNYSYADGNVTIDTPDRPALADYTTGANAQPPEGNDRGATDMPDEDLSTSEDAASDGTSEDAATRSREQVIREIQLRERGILLPKGA